MNFMVHLPNIPLGNYVITCSESTIKALHRNIHGECQNGT